MNFFHSPPARKTLWCIKLLTNSRVIMFTKIIENLILNLYAFLVHLIIKILNLLIEISINYPLFLERCLSFSRTQRSHQISFYRK